MVAHTQAIRRLLLTNCLSVFDHFVGMAHIMRQACSIINAFQSLLCHVEILIYQIIRKKKLN